MKISREIDEYNAVNREIASRYNIYYIDITEWTREAVNNPTLLAPDGLHPSAKEYQRWAAKLVEYFMSKI
jgi:lysophospholipase L1-like esterase